MAYRVASTVVMNNRNLFRVIIPCFASIIILGGCYLHLFPYYYYSFGSHGKLGANTANLSNLDYGINVFGWPKGDFGLGGATRAIILCLYQNNIALSAIAVNGAEGHTHDNTLISELALPEFPKDYSIDLLAAPPPSTVGIISLAANKFGHNRYRIGFWLWEASHLPT